MIQSLWTSESGLKSMQVGMDVLGYNLANINTQGFKKTEVTFKDVFSQSYNVPLVNQNPLEKGLGSLYADVRKIMSQGDLIDGTSATDMAINGDGFFVLNKDGNQVYSRVGNFRFDPGEYSTSDGFPVIGSDGQVNYYLGNPTLSKSMKLVNSNDGATVQGWLADSAGAIDTSGSISDIVLTDSTFHMPPLATTAASIANNLNANTTLSTLNSNALTKVITNNAEYTDNLDNYIDISGTAIEKRKGEYSITVKPDGSAIVSFLEDGKEIAETVNYAAGTVSTTKGTNSTLDLTTLAPGLKLSLKNDVTEPIEFKISNAGENLTQHYSNEAVVYDSSGDQHNLITTFNKLSENKWVWDIDLFNEEHFIGSGNAETFTLSNDIDPSKTLSITAKDSLTGVSRTVPTSQYSMFEDNKLVTNGLFNPTEVVTVSYTDKLGNSRTENFSEPERSQTFVLDKNVDPDSIQIFINDSETAVNSNYYTVKENKILPVDTNGDGKNDYPFFYPGSDVTVRYRLSDQAKSITNTVKDTFPGTGYASNIELTYLPDNAKDITLSIKNKVTGETRSLSTSDFTLTDNVLQAKDTNADGIADSPLISADEVLTVDYTANVDKITTNESFALDGSVKALNLKGVAETGTVKVYKNGTLLPESAYTVSNNQIFPNDTDSDGSLNALGSSGDTIKVEYQFIEPRKGIITFDADGNVTGGNLNPTITYNIKTAADPLKITVDMSDLKQFNGSTDFTYSDINGHTDGFLKQLQVYTDGRIAGQYENGETQDIARVALSTFSNPEGLMKYGDNYFDESANSGTVNITTAGVDTVAGMIYGDKLETSNVDMADSFSTMIVLQRAYQLNSRGITTSDEMIQQAINTKRT